MIVYLIMLQRSFLKWPGGKYRSVNQLLCLFPKEFGTYYEPFAGSAVVCLNVKAERKVVSDIEDSLMNAHEKVKTCVGKVIDCLDEFNNSSDAYYDIREEFNSASDSFSYSDAARFIYLNKCGFNGLYRRNKNGGFNVSFGKRSGNPHKDFENLRSCSQLLHGVELMVGGYESCLSDVAVGDFVYLDPPYVKESGTSFTGYNSNQFDNSANRKLSDFCRDLDSSGVLFAVSNSNTKLIREWYDGFHIRELQAVRSISREGRSRGRCTELLITNY